MVSQNERIYEILATVIIVAIAAGWALILFLGIDNFRQVGEMIANAI